jgi:hypothetical protein
MKKLFSLFLIAAITWTGCKDKVNTTDKTIPQQNGIIAADSELHVPVDTQKIHVVHYYKPNYTLLYGKLYKETHYGAPGYGKNPDTDKKEDVYFLVTDKPFDIRTNLKSKDRSYEDIDNVNKIQLISMADFNDKILASSDGKDVVVKGMLIRNKGEHKPSEAALELIGIH